MSKTYNNVITNGKVREIIFSLDSKEWKLYPYYLQILSHRNNNPDDSRYRWCCPSYATLMEETGIKSQHTILRWNKRLKELGLLNWYHDYDKGTKKRGPNYYFFPMEKRITTQDNTDEAKSEPEL